MFLFSPPSAKWRQSWSRHLIFSFFCLLFSFLFTFFLSQLAELGAGARSAHNKLRIVALSASVANADDLANWIGVPAALDDDADVSSARGGGAAGLYSFHPNVRPTPLDIHVQGFTCGHFGERMLAMAKPCFNAICIHASRLALTVGGGRGGAARSSEDQTIVFVTSRKQAMLTAIDLMTFAAAAGDAEMFVGGGAAGRGAIEEAIGKLIASSTAALATTGADTEVDRIAGNAAAQSPAAAKAARAAKAVEALVGALRVGVGYWHSGLGAYAKRLVAALYARGALGVVVATQASCWGLPFAAKLVVLMGGQRYDSREAKYVDCAIADVLQMVGCACRPQRGADGKGGVCVILCQNARKAYYKKFLYEPLPVESHLDHRLADHMNSEIVVKTVENKQDAVDYLTWSFYYRRINQNPGYYNLVGVTPQHMSDHLSELVEDTLNDLAEARCVEIDDIDVRPLNLGMVSSYYYAQCVGVARCAARCSRRAVRRARRPAPCTLDTRPCSLAAHRRPVGALANALAYALTRAASLFLASIHSFPRRSRTTAPTPPRYTSIELFSSSITAKTKVKGLLTILCAATEFEATEVRPSFLLFARHFFCLLLVLIYSVCVFLRCARATKRASSRASGSTCRTASTTSSTRR